MELIAKPKNKTRGVGRRSKNPGFDTMYRLYVTEDRSAEEIGKMYGVAASTVKAWIWRLNKERQEVGSE